MTHWLVNKPDSTWSRSEWATIWRRRELAYFLASRDIRVRYKQTFFGVGWALLQPLATLAAFVFFFGDLLEAPSDGLPYASFALAGLVIWTFFASAVGAAARSLVDHRPLVEKVYFPRILAPLAAVLAALPDLLISVALLVAFIAVVGAETEVIPALTTPIWLLAAVLLACGFGVGLAALNVLYRDAQYALGFVLQLWLFVSPVAYPSSLVDGPALWLFACNPMVGVLDGVRWAMLGAPPPRVEDLASMVIAILVLVTAFVYFRRVERRLADRI